jgi:uncharacterized membrane protein
MISTTPNWHPVFVHFTIALYTTAALLFAVHVATAKISWSGVALTGARVNLWIGAAVTIVTVAAGIHAFLIIHSMPCPINRRHKPSKPSGIHPLTAGH